MNEQTNSKADTPIDLLTVNDVAKRMKLSTRSVWRLVDSGSIVLPIKIGGSIRWRSTDFNLWLASHPLEEERGERKTSKNQMIDRQDHGTIESEDRHNVTGGNHEPS